MNKRILNCQRKERKLCLTHFPLEQQLGEFGVEAAVERINALKLDEPEVPSWPPRGAVVGD